MLFLARHISAVAAAAVSALTQRIDRRIDRHRLSVAPALAIVERVARFTVVGIDHVATGAARGAIIARLVVGAHLPQERVVKPGLVDVEHRDRHAQAGRGAAIRLLEIGAAGLFQPLDDPADVGQADFWELRIDRAPAVFEHAENVARRNRVPGRQRIQDRQRPARLLGVGHGAEHRLAISAQPARGRFEHRRFARAVIAFAEDVVLERHDSVVVRSAAPQHRPGGHDRAFRRLDDFHVARPARLARNAIVRRVDEADEFGRLA